MNVALRPYERRFPRFEPHDGAPKATGAGPWRIELIVKLARDIDDDRPPQEDYAVPKLGLYLHRTGDVLHWSAEWDDAIRFTTQAQADAFADLHVSGDVVAVQGW